MEANIYSATLAHQGRKHLDHEHICVTSISLKRKEMFQTSLTRKHFTMIIYYSFCYFYIPTT